MCLRRTGLVSYPAWLGQRIVPYLGGNYVTRFLLAKRYLSGVGDLEGFRWVPQPVRPTFGVIANQMHFLGPGSQLVGSKPRFLVLKGKRTPFVNVLQAAERVFFPYLQWCLSVQNVRGRTVDFQLCFFSLLGCLRPFVVSSPGHNATVSLQPMPLFCELYAEGPHDGGVRQVTRR